MHKSLPDDGRFRLLLLGRPVVHREAGGLITQTLNLHMQNTENKSSCGVWNLGCGTSCLRIRKLQLEAISKNSRIELLLYSKILRDLPLLFQNMASISQILIKMNFWTLVGWWPW